MDAPGLFQGRNCGQEEGAARKSQRRLSLLNGPKYGKVCTCQLGLTPSEAYNHTAEHPASRWT